MELKEENWEPLPYPQVYENVHCKSPQTKDMIIIQKKKHLKMNLIGQKDKIVSEEKNRKEEYKIDKEEKNN